MNERIVERARFHAIGDDECIAQFPLRRQQLDESDVWPALFLKEMRLTEGSGWRFVA